jgi:hypothetical protein
MLEVDPLFATELPLIFSHVVEVGMGEGDVGIEEDKDGVGGWEGVGTEVGVEEDRVASDGGVLGADREGGGGEGEGEGETEEEEEAEEEEGVGESSSELFLRARFFLPFFDANFLFFSF